MLESILVGLTAKLAIFANTVLFGPWGIGDGGGVANIGATPAGLVVTLVTTAVIPAFTDIVVWQLAFIEYKFKNLIKLNLISYIYLPKASINGKNNKNLNIFP